MDGLTTRELFELSYLSTLHTGFVMYTTTLRICTMHLFTPTTQVVSRLPDTPDLLRGLHPVCINIGDIW